MKRKQHITAFYLETLLMIVVFISIILVLTRVFGSARVQSVEAKRLTAAVTLAQNTAEAASASGSPQDLLDLLNEKNNAILQTADDTEETVIITLYDENLQPVEITQQAADRLQSAGSDNSKKDGTKTGKNDPVPGIQPGTLIVETQWGAPAPAAAETETEDPEAANPEAANPDAMALEAGEDLVNVTIRVCGADRTTEIYRLDTAVYAPADR